MGLHFPLPWVNRNEGTNEYNERNLIIEESWYVNYEGKQGIPKLPISYSSIKWNKQQTRQINCTCLSNCDALGGKDEATNLEFPPPTQIKYLNKEPREKDVARNV